MIQRWIQEIWPPKHYWFIQILHLYVTEFSIVSHPFSFFFLFFFLIWWSFAVFKCTIVLLITFMFLIYVFIYYYIIFFMETIRFVSA